MLEDMTRVTPMMKLTLKTQRLVSETVKEHVENFKKHKATEHKHARIRVKMDSKCLGNVIKNMKIFKMK